MVVANSETKHEAKHESKNIDGTFKNALNKKRYDWSKLDAEAPGVMTAIKGESPYARFMQEMLAQGQTYLSSEDMRAKKGNIMAEQEWVYAAIAQNPRFLESYRQEKFLAGCMLVDGCGYGVSTTEKVDTGVLICYKQNTVDLLAFSADMDSAALANVVIEKDSAWVKGGCTNEGKLGPSIGREIHEKDITVRKQRGRNGYDLWIKEWGIWDGDQKIYREEDGEEFNAQGKIFVKPYSKANGEVCIKYSVVTYNRHDFNGKGGIYKDILTDIPAPNPFSMGKLSSLKEKLFDVMIAKGHVLKDERERAKPRTARSLYNNLGKHWQLIMANLDEKGNPRPVRYKTRNGKWRDNARFVRFYLHEHEHSGLIRKSLKMNKVWIKPNHLDCMSGNAAGDKFDTTQLSHIILTEGAISKGLLGNLLLAITTQFDLWQKRKIYLPICLYYCQDGTHKPIPFENLKFLYELWSMRHLLSEEQLDRNFYYLLGEEEGQDRYSSLTTPEGIKAAANLILTVDNLRKAVRLEDFENMQLLLQSNGLSPETLAECSTTEINKLRILLQGRKETKTLQLLDEKLSLINQAARIYGMGEQVKATQLLDKFDEAVAQATMLKGPKKERAFETIEALLADISIELLLLDLSEATPAFLDWTRVNKLKELAIQEQKFSIVSLFDKKLAEWGDNKYRDSTAALEDKSAKVVGKMAIQKPKTELERLEQSSNKADIDAKADVKYYKFPAALAASVAQSNHDWSCVKKIADQKGFNSGEAGLGEAVLRAAKDQEWDIVKYLVGKKVKDFNCPDTDTANGYYAIHYAIKYGQLDIVKLLAANGANLNVKWGSQGITPIDLAKKLADQGNSRMAGIVSFLKEQHVKETEIQHLALEGDWSKVRELAKNNPNDSGVGDALLRAGDSNQFDVVIDLITNYNVREFSWRFVQSEKKPSSQVGFFLVHLAAKAGRLDVVQLIFEKTKEKVLVKAREDAIRAKMSPSEIQKVVEDAEKAAHEAGMAVLNNQHTNDYNKQSIVLCMTALDLAEETQTPDAKKVAAWLRSQGAKSTPKALSEMDSEQAKTSAPKTAKLVEPPTPPVRQSGSPRGVTPFWNGKEEVQGPVIYHSPGCGK